MTPYEDLEALASQMTYKASFHDIPFGGAKGCIYINPNDYTYEEKVKIVRRFTVELWKRSMIGASTDVMGVDIGTDDQIMNIIRDTYKNVISNNSTELDACVTGKGVFCGGLESSKIASGYGTARCLKYIQENLNNKILGQTRLGSGGSTKSIILHGLTKDSINFANFLPSRDFKIIGIVDGDYGCFNPMGFNIDEVVNYKKIKGSLEGISKVLNNPNDILSKRCDIFVACKEQLVTKEIAENLNCKLIVEAANLPLQKEAINIVREKGIILLPDLISYSGGFIVSYLEWLKNLEHRNLTLLFKRFESNSITSLKKMLSTSDFGTQTTEYKGPDENDLILTSIEEITDTSFKNLLNIAEEKNLDLRTAAYTIALGRLYEKIKSSGGISI
jgi:glutamate dehydrogenase (NAD(P)+)